MSFGNRERRIECLGPVARQTKDERPQHVYAVLAKLAQPLDE
jgi:hypothetical protein